MFAVGNMIRARCICFWRWLTIFDARSAVAFVRADDLNARRRSMAGD